MKQAVTPLSIETPTKSGNTDRGLMKKLKEFDGLAMSIGNGTAEIAEGGAEHRLSERFVESFSRLCNMLTFFFLRILPCRCPTCINLPTRPLAARLT